MTSAVSVDGGGAKYWGGVGMGGRGVGRVVRVEEGCPGSVDKQQTRLTSVIVIVTEFFEVVESQML